MIDDNLYIFFLYTHKHTSHNQPIDWCLFETFDAIIIFMNFFLSFRLKNQNFENYSNLLVDFHVPKGGENCKAKLFIYAFCTFFTTEVSTKHWTVSDNYKMHVPSAHNDFEWHTKRNIQIWNCRFYLLSALRAAWGRKECRPFVVHFYWHDVLVPLLPSLPRCKLIQLKCCHKFIDCSWSREGRKK